MIENHLGFEPLLALRLLAEIDQAFGVEKRIGVALQAARIPGQVDEKPVQYLFSIRARRLVRCRRCADLPQISPLCRRGLRNPVSSRTRTAS
jgi:hypothetical protein